MDDDWKGEKLISAKTTKAQNAIHSRTIAANIGHILRRKKGIPMPNSIVSSHSAFVKSALYRKPK